MRHRLIRLIHVAKRELHMSEDGYRAALASATGLRSTSSMTSAQLELVVKHLKKCGFKVRSSLTADRRPDNAPTSSKLRSLWLSLAAIGEVRDQSETALAHWVERETGIAALQWLSSDDASRCIEKMKMWRFRVLTKRRGDLLEAMSLMRRTPATQAEAAIERAALTVLGRSLNVETMSGEDFAKLLAETASNREAT